MHFFGRDNYNRGIFLGKKVSFSYKSCFVFSFSREEPYNCVYIRFKDLKTILTSVQREQKRGEYFIFVMQIG